MLQFNGMRSYCEVQTIQNRDVSCRIPEPNVLELELDTLVSLTQIAPEK